MANDFDVLVVGAGPAGSATAVLLAQAGWRVALAEQSPYPRRKVCGECIGAGTLALLDVLGVGAPVQRAAGPALWQVAWVSERTTAMAALPVCLDGPYPYGRALSRARLDELLLERARALGVEILQPVKVNSVYGLVGHFRCELEPRPLRTPTGAERVRGRVPRLLRTAIVVDARGSEERSAPFGREAARCAIRRRPLGSDLLAFKANFHGALVAAHLLPLLAFRGGYGGMVVSGADRTTLACCVRRDTLRNWRASAPGERAGEVIEQELRRQCQLVDAALCDARREGMWLSAGPVRPGIRVTTPPGVFAVGNAAGECHPLIGEGIGMALQSAVLLTDRLKQRAPGALGTVGGSAVQAEYARAWRNAFAVRVRWSSIYAQWAMRPLLLPVAAALLNRWPGLLTNAARLAGKANRSVHPVSLATEAA